MKAIGVAMALLLVGLGALSAQTLDASALERAHKFGQEFKTGVIQV